MIIIVGDLNTKVGSEPLSDIAQGVNEDIGNGELLKVFCAADNMIINNTFFNYIMKYKKYTWQNSRGQQSCPSAECTGCRKCQ